MKTKGELTNTDKAKFAEVAVKAYAEKTGLASPDEDEETKVSDLVADLMHYCDRTGVDWSTVMYRAHRHYGEEVKEQSKARRKS